ncbi:MAG TPA: hypothetical protein VNE58_17050 [Casimicrobiaceae bacterium]|nr:hypothetical protein [Casimicrobiaceae bacterium]
MALLKRWLGAGLKQPDKAPAPSEARVEESPIEATAIGDVMRVEEVTSAEFYAGDLFRRRFRTDPPDFPRHYVAFYRDGRTRYVPVGYVHYSAFEDMFLCGGMVIDDRLYRRIVAPHRKLIKDAGGIAETMLRETFARLSHAPAIWGYVGDKQARDVDLRAGFHPTHHQHVMVVWNRELSEADKAGRLARVIAVGPF